MDEQERLRILSGRQAVDAYRQAHVQLHWSSWHNGIPGEHTPLLDTMLGELKKQDFSSLQGFFHASEELNIKELGFASSQDFKTRATDAEREVFERMWR